MRAVQPRFAGAQIKESFCILPATIHVYREQIGLTGILRVAGG